MIERRLNVHPIEIVVIKHAENMADIVENVLRETAQKESKYKTNEVRKDIDLEIDEGNLLTNDTNPTELKDYR